MNSYFMYETTEIWMTSPTGGKCSVYTSQWDDHKVNEIYCPFRLVRFFVNFHRLHEIHTHSSPSQPPHNWLRWLTATSSKCMLSSIVECSLSLLQHGIIVHCLECLNFRSSFTYNSSQPNIYTLTTPIKTDNDEILHIKSKCVHFIWFVIYDMVC